MDNLLIWYYIYRTLQVTRIKVNLKRFFLEYIIQIYRELHYCSRTGELLDGTDPIKKLFSTLRR